MSPHRLCVCVSKFKNEGWAAGFPSQLHRGHRQTSARQLALRKNRGLVAPTSEGCHENVS